MFVNANIKCIIDLDRSTVDDTDHAIYSVDDTDHAIYSVDTDHAIYLVGDTDQ